MRRERRQQGEPAARRDARSSSAPGRSAACSSRCSRPPAPRPVIVVEPQASAGGRRERRSGRTSVVRPDELAARRRRAPAPRRGHPRRRGRAASWRRPIEHAALGGRIVLFGMNQTARPPIHQYTITDRSLSVLGAYVTAFTFPTAIRLVEGGSLPLDPIVTHVLPLDRVSEGLDLLRSGDATKVVITPGGAARRRDGPDGARPLHRFAASTSLRGGARRRGARSARRASRSRPAASPRRRICGSTSCSATPRRAVVRRRVRAPRPADRRAQLLGLAACTPSSATSTSALIRSTFRLAAELGVRKIVSMSGCPGRRPGGVDRQLRLVPVAGRRAWRCSSDSGRRRSTSGRTSPRRPGTAGCRADRLRAPPAASRLQRARPCSGCARPSGRSSGRTSIRRTCSGSRWTRWPSSGRSDRRSTTCISRTPRSCPTRSRSPASSTSARSTTRRKRAWVFRTVGERPRRRVLVGVRGGAARRRLRRRARDRERGCRPDPGGRGRAGGAVHAPLLIGSATERSHQNRLERRAGRAPIPTRTVGITLRTLIQESVPHRNVAQLGERPRPRDRRRVKPRHRQLVDPYPPALGGRGDDRVAHDGRLVRRPRSSPAPATAAGRR